MFYDLSIIGKFKFSVNIALHNTRIIDLWISDLSMGICKFYKT